MLSNKKDLALPEVSQQPLQHAAPPNRPEKPYPLLLNCTKKTGQLALTNRPIPLQFVSHTHC